MHARPKIIALDVDGTLLNSSHAILPSTKQALARLASAGHHILLATARPPKSVAGIVQQLGIGSAMFIALNGATIVRQNKIIQDLPMDRDSIGQIIKESRRQGLHANIMADWDWFVEGASIWCEEEAAIVQFQPETVPDLLDPALPPAHKILVMGETPAIASFQGWVLTQGLPLSVSLSKPNYCEIVHQGVSKAHALQEVAQMLSIRAADIIAFGDGENDMELIEMAGIGIAMGNSMPKVLAVADLITKSNDADGIYHALLQLDLISPHT